MENNFLGKIKEEKKIVCDKLDLFCEKGININQIDEFNRLCDLEMILTNKENLLENGISKGITTKISRRINFNPIITEIKKENNNNNK